MPRKSQDPTKNYNDSYYFNNNELEKFKTLYPDLYLKLMGEREDEEPTIEVQPSQKKDGERPYFDPKYDVTLGPEYKDPVTGKDIRDLNVPATPSNVDVTSPAYKDFEKEGFIEAPKYGALKQGISDEHFRNVLQKAVETFVRASDKVLDKAPNELFDRPEFDTPQQRFKALYPDIASKFDGTFEEIPELLRRPDETPSQAQTSFPDILKRPPEEIKKTEATDFDATRDVKKDFAKITDILGQFGKNISASTKGIKKTEATDFDATQGDKMLSKEEQLELARKNPDIFGGFLGQARSAKVKQAMDYEPTEAEIDAEMQKRFPRKLTPRERVFGIGDDVTTTDWLKQKTTADTASAKSLEDLLNAQRKLKAFRYENIKSFGGESAEQKALQKAAQRYGITSLADVPEDKRVTAYGNIFARAAREYSETGVNKEQYFQDVLGGKYSDRFTEGQKKAFEKNPEGFAKGFANKLAREEIASRKKQFKSTFRGTEYDPYVGADTIAKKYEYTEAGSTAPEVGLPSTDIERGGQLAKGLRAAEKKYAEGRTRAPSQEEQMFNYWNEPSNKRYQADMLRRRLAADASFAGQFQMQTGIAGIDAVKMSDRDLTELQLKSIGLGK